MHTSTRSTRTFGATAAAFALTALALAALAACTTDSGMDGPDMTGRVALQAVSPADGVSGVSITLPMVMRFSGPLGGGMERYVAVHEGSVAGPVVAGGWSWSADRRTLTFTPDTPLKSRSTYVIHMGGGVQGSNGMPMDDGSCTALGGRAVTGAMMGGSAAAMMGPGWLGSDGTYGMVFTFTTA